MSDVLDAIVRKRDGNANTQADFEALCRAEADSDQLAAWLMAAYLQGLNHQETVSLTLAMASSGERLDLSALPKPWIDKHSTGGIGDKTTLVLLPLLAACGLTVVKMSGAGLGITGGTVDKLQSIPGFRVDLTPEEMLDQAGRIGLALTGQTKRLAPADKRLYELRGVTGTVASVPLIVASILSKKIAGGSDAVVFDVKCGSGAFMPRLESAMELAAGLTRVGEGAGLSVRASVTDMDQPLGAAGNALEVREAFSLLSGEPTNPRLRELALHMAGHALELAGKNPAPALEALQSGRALAKAQAWVEAQGGRWGETVPLAPSVHVLEYRGEPGWVARWDARAVGEVVLNLGGGRRSSGRQVDLGVGVASHVVVGDRLEPGQPVATIYARTDDAGMQALDALRRGLETSGSPVIPRPIVLRP